MESAGPIFYSAGYKYQVRKDWWVATSIVAQACRIEDEDLPGSPWIELEGNGVLRVREGYALDGPSGPTIDTKTFMCGALIHDALYQLIRLGHLAAEPYRKTADDILRRVCLKDGMCHFRAFYVYWSVRLFAASSARPRSECACDLLNINSED